MPEYMGITVPKMPSICKNISTITKDSCEECIRIGNKALFLVRHFKKIIWRAVENLAKCFNAFIANGFCFVVDHIVEILITHAKLHIQPVFCLAITFQ